MDSTIYKRGEGGKKVISEKKTKAINVKFKDRNVEIEKRIYIGRSATNKIRIQDDPLVSRRHAVIEKTGEDYIIKDLGSTNGTYLNNNPVPAQGKALKPGDEIRVGKTKLRLG